MAKKQKNASLTTQMKGRLEIVFICILALFLLLVGFLAYYSIIKGDEYSTKVLDNQDSSSTSIPYERGKIYDRNGNILATNEKKYSLVLEPKNILSSDDTLNHTVNILHKYLNLNKKTLKSYINKHADSYYQVYKKDLTYDEVEEIQDFLALQTQSTSSDNTDEENAQIKSAKKVAGVVFEESYDRIYPNDSLACRVLGYTLSGNVGNWGIEQYYNDELNGKDGRSYSYLNQELVTERTVKEAVNGKSLVSTLDIDVQKIIEEQIEAFDNKIGSSNTSVLVMNPQNGEILGMASSNPYNLNDPQNEEDLEQIYSTSQIEAMKEYTEALEAAEKEGDEAVAELKENSETTTSIYDAFSKLQRNPIISDANEPGSTYKAVTVATGLESGILTGDETYYCTGSLKVADRSIGCAHVHGSITLKEAVSQSCNVAMMNIAFKEGAETFYSYQNMFGFGQKTEIDLPGEANTSSLVYNATNYSNDATLATNAFGQNFNGTMIQMAAAYSALVNGGTYYQPHVVKQILSDDGTVDEEIGTEAKRKIISEETSDTIKEYLRATVTEGTGTIADIPGYTVAGKTGTAEKIPRNKSDYYISFMGVNSIENPQVLVYVTIDEPNVANQASVSLATELNRRCMEDILVALDITPDDKDAYDEAVKEGTYEMSDTLYEGFTALN